MNITVNFGNGGDQCHQPTLILRQQVSRPRSFNSSARIAEVSLGLIGYKQEDLDRNGAYYKNLE
jgi:hypothetical protein